MRGHVTLCYMVVGGNLNSPLNLFISFAKALMEQGFRSDLFLAKDRFAGESDWVACSTTTSDRLPGITGTGQGRRTALPDFEACHCGRNHCRSSSDYAQT